MSIAKTIPFSNGIARVLSRADLDHYEVWTRAFEGKTKDHRFYEIVADTLGMLSNVRRTIDVLVGQPATCLVPRVRGGSIGESCGRIARDFGSIFRN